jgi:hypothetical protein
MKILIVLILLAAAAGGLWYMHEQHGLGYLKISFGDEEESEPGVMQAPNLGWQPPAMPAAVPLAVGGTVMKWTQDERWTRGVESGEKGVALIELATYEHFEVKGDPFLFRARKEEAADLLTQAIGELTSLKESFAKDEAALLDINPLLRKYEASLAKTPRR